MIIRKLFIVSVVTLAFAACGTQKNVVKPTSSVPLTTPSISKTTSDAKTANTAKQQSLAFLQKVYDKALYQKNLVADLTFTLNRNGRNISVPGILHMRKDEVIRLQLLIPLLRSEVGRIEFTKDYVLFIDRIHKQYVKAAYNDVSFLRNNGIDFYSLQALFWNEFFVPGQQGINEAALQNFDVKLATLQAGQVNVPVVLKDKRMTYTWLVSNPDSQINKAQASYVSTSHGTSTLIWDYANFNSFGSKQFPALHEITIETQATAEKKRIRAKFELNGSSDPSDWETITTPSSSYTKVRVEDILGKLMNL